ncbi:MAG: DUF6470 family protein [Bacillota bacterium]
MDLRISSTPALIGVKTNWGKLEMKQPAADMDIQIQKPSLEIRSEQIKVQIDQSQCFSEAGLKGIDDFMKERVGVSKKGFQKGLAKIVRQGNEMMQIDTGINVIAKQAKESMFEDKAQLTLVSMPKSRPKIDFMGGTVDIQVVEGAVDVNVQVNKPVGNYIPGNVDIYLKQKNSLNIEYVGNQLDTTA